MGDGDRPVMTYELGAEAFVIDAFGWELTNEGIIWDGDVVFSVTGRPVHIDDLAGIVEYEGEPTPLRDDFNELVEYVKYRHECANAEDGEGDWGDWDE